MNVVLEKLNQKIGPVVASMNLIYWGTVLVAEGGRTVLRVYVDKEGGVSIDDCAAVSRSLSALFDVEEPVTGRYSLEVSSPGINRPLLNQDHYQQSVAKDVCVQLHEAIDNKKKLTGLLVSVDDAGIVLRVNDEEHAIKFNQIKRANLNA